MEANLLDKTLTDYQDRKVPVTLVLQNRARVSGTIRTFDSYVIIVDSHKAEIIYRHAVSSLAPATTPQPVRTAARQPAPRRERETVRETNRPAKSPAKTAIQPRQQKPPAPAASLAEPSLNTGMQEGLQRWLQGQKK